MTEFGFIFFKLAGLSFSYAISYLVYTQTSVPPSSSLHPIVNLLKEHPKMATDNEVGSLKSLQIIKWSCTKLWGFFPTGHAEIDTNSSHFPVLSTYLFPFFP